MTNGEEGPKLDGRKYGAMFQKPFLDSKQQAELDAIVKHAGKQGDTYTRTHDIMALARQAGIDITTADALAMIEAPHEAAPTSGPTEYDTPLSFPEEPDPDDHNPFEIVDPDAPSVSDDIKEMKHELDTEDPKGEQHD